MENDPLYCPRCSKPAFERIQANMLQCSGCSFTYFHNTAAAVGAVIRRGNETLMGIRARQPEKDKLDFPGGFVDPGENLEQALRRELEEELGRAPDSIEYLCSHPNTYPYKDVLYTTCDSFFLCHYREPDSLSPGDDVAELHWIDVNHVDIDDCAFESTKAIIEQLRRHR